MKRAWERVWNFGRKLAASTTTKVAPIANTPDANAPRAIHSGSAGTCVSANGSSTTIASMSSTRSTTIVDNPCPIVSRRRAADEQRTRRVADAQGQQLRQHIADILQVKQLDKADFALEHVLPAQGTQRKIGQHQQQCRQQPAVVGCAQGSANRSRIDEQKDRRQAGQADENAEPELGFAKGRLLHCAAIIAVIADDPQRCRKSLPKISLMLTKKQPCRTAESARR